MRTKHFVYIALCAFTIIALIAVVGVPTAGDSTSAAAQDSEQEPATTTTEAPPPPETTTSTTIDEEQLGQFLVAVAAAEASTTTTTTTTAPAPPPTPAPKPQAPSCSTWGSQEEADAWMDANASSHDTSNIDTNGDGRACTLHFAPAPAPSNGPSVAAPAPSSGACWDCLAQCESGGNWHINTGNGFSGGLQFWPQTWIGFGGLEFAPEAWMATREQQIAVAERVLAVQGRNAWPGCTAAGAW